MKMINKYRYVQLTKEGTSTQEVLADNRKEAQLALRAPMDEVQFVEQVPMTHSQRRLRHMMRFPHSLWSLHTIKEAHVRVYGRRMKKDKKDKEAAKKGGK